jgi:predicted DNA-binding WGR domain protein
MKRMFEFRDETSAKFWEITLEGSTVITRYGKVGSSGNNARKSFADKDTAKKEFEKLIKEKTRKGYLELGVTDAPTSSAPIGTAQISTAPVRAATTTGGVTTYLENADLNEFFEVNENNNQIRVRRGKIGQPCLEYHAGYKTKGRENYDGLIKDWKKKGFKVSQPKSAILPGSIAHELIAADIDDHPVYSRIFGMGWGEELRGQQKRIFVFKNGLNWIGNFDFEEMVDMDLTTGVIIEGDVNVSGVLSQLTYEYPNPILITGNVMAQSFGHKDSHMRIDGDLRVENIVYGEYNDGSLEIGGDVHGKAWISADHNMYANGTYFLPSFDDEYDGLSPKVLDSEGGLDWDALRECVWENKNPVRKNFVFVAPKPKIRSATASDLEHKLASGEQVESFKESDRVWTAPVDNQVGEAHQAHPDVQAIVEAMTFDDVDQILRMLATVDTGLLKAHSWLLLDSARYMFENQSEGYKEVIEKLLESGCDPRLAYFSRNMVEVVLEGDDQSKDEVLELFYRHVPELRPNP